MDLKALEDEINRGEILGSSSLRKLGSNLVRSKVGVLQVRLDFNIQGGAVSTINLFDPLEDPGTTSALPAKAIIKQVTVNCITPPTSGGAATVSFGANGVADLLAATAVASLTGLVAGIPNGASANMVVLAAKSPITATIAAAALTAGQMDVIVEYYVPSNA